MSPTKNLKTDLVWEKLQHLLARRAHSEKELMQKLKAFDRSEVEQAIKRAKQNKWLEEPEDMAIKITEELNRKKKGWLYIKCTLKKKGLPSLSKNPAKEKEKALDLLSKKSRTDPHITPKAKVSLYRFLSNRGFEGSDIKEAFKDFFSS